MKAHTAEASSMHLWHQRLGHTGHEKLLHMKRHNTAYGFQLTDTTRIQCEGCDAGRIDAKPSVSVPARKCLPGERLSMDLCGAMRVQSMGGSSYFLVLTDERTCFRSIYFIGPEDKRRGAQACERICLMGRAADWQQSQVYPQRQWH